MLVGDDVVAERLEAFHRQWPHLMDLNRKQHEKEGNDAPPWHACTQSLLRFSQYHLAGDPHRDEREELQVAVPEGLDQPRPNGPSTSCAAEPHLPATNMSGRKNSPQPKTEIVSGSGRSTAITSEARGGSVHRRTRARST